MFFTHMAKMGKAKQDTQNPRLIRLCKIRDILCEEVPKYPVLYDGQLPDHHNSNVTDQAWSNILEEMKKKGIVITSELPFLHLSVTRKWSRSI